MNIITFISASGQPGVIWPAPDAQLAGESDADFIQRIETLSLPAGATSVRVIDSSAYTPPAPNPQPPTPRAWLERLAPSSQAAIAAAASNPAILLWLLKAAGTPQIDVSASETVAGVGALVAAGVISSADEAVLLAP